MVYKDENTREELHDKHNKKEEPKPPVLSNEEFQNRVLESLEDIQALTFQNFVQTYLILTEKLSKYLS